MEFIPSALFAIAFFEVLSKDCPLFVILSVIGYDKKSKVRQG